MVVTNGYLPVRSLLPMLQQPIANDVSGFGRFAPRGLIARIVDITSQCPSNWAGKRRAFFLRAIAVRLLHGEPLDVSRFGARMRLYPYNNVCEKRILFTPQFFDAAELALLHSRMHDNFVFLDIGANIGGYALFAAAHAGQGARILAIEPQRDMFERLVYNIRQNPFATVKALDCAVADIDGEITLFVNPRNRGQTSMRIITSEVGSTRVRVPAKALMHIVRDEGFGHIDAAKVDVQGAEDLILDSFFNDAPPSLWPGLMIIENSQRRWELDLSQRLAQCGYKEILRTHNNSVFERT
jgi:FkbM family methyltransferase